MEIKKTIADAIKTLFKKTKGIYIWNMVVKDGIMYIWNWDVVLRFKTDSKEEWIVKDFWKMMGWFYAMGVLNYELENIHPEHYFFKMQKEWTEAKEKSKMKIKNSKWLQDMAKRLPDKNFNNLLVCIHFMGDGRIEASDSYYLEQLGDAYEWEGDSETCIEAKYLALWEVRYIKETEFEFERIQTIYYDDYSITIRTSGNYNKSYPDTQRVFDMYDEEETECTIDFYQFLKDKKLIKDSTIQHKREAGKCKIILNYDISWTYNEVINAYDTENGDWDMCTAAKRVKKFKGTFKVRKTTMYHEEWNYKVMIRF